MAEPASRRLNIGLPLADLLLALDAAPELDTGTLVCLAGRWSGGDRLVYWDPDRIVHSAGPQLPGELEAATGEQADWVGWLAFDAGSWFGRFDRRLRLDGAGNWWLESIAGAGQPAELAALIEEIAVRPLPPSEPARLDELTSTARDEHLSSVERAISAIRAGQLYQVNVCARIAARLTGSPLALFTAGLAELHADYAALIRTPRRTAVSFSPELFLHRQGTEVRTGPIKGTRARLGDEASATEDPAATDLLHSPKDRAENVMIVDLMRNDLSRVCRPGSVRVGALLAVRPAPGVWHLVSEVTGQLAGPARDAELVSACFPPGSVTGAPKLRAVGLIAELEPAGRGLFTGAIGRISPDETELSVAIRTFEITGDRVELGVGGGITADSVPMLEWRECLTKAAPLLAVGRARLVEPLSAVPEQVEPDRGVYETMLAVDGRIVALADHLSRLAGSCGELYRLRLPEDLAGRLIEAAGGSPGRCRLRVTVTPDGRPPRIEVAPAGPSGGRVRLYRCPGRTGNWRHKWADRRWLSGLETERGLPLFSRANPEPGTDANTTELALETSRGNLAVVVRPGVLWTPPSGDDVLPGVTRRRLIDAAVDRGWQVRLAPVPLGCLADGALVLSLSSIRGVVGVESLDGHRLNHDAGLLDELGGWLD